jgi:hypothetical protein
MLDHKNYAMLDCIFAVEYLIDHFARYGRVTAQLEAGHP